MLTPRLPSFFKTPVQKQFEYRPRYYDPVQDDLEERIRAIEKEMKPGQTTADVRPRMAMKFKRAKRFAESAKQRRQSNLRVIMIIVFLGILVWWIL